MVFDATALNMAVRGATPPDAPPADPSGGTTPPAGDQGTGKGASQPVSTEAINSILEKHGLESPDQLGDYIDSLAQLKGKLGDADLDEVIENHKTFQKLKAKQEADALKQREENETPEETIARLKKEREERDREIARRDKQAKNAEQARAAVTSFNSTIRSYLKSESLSPAMQKLAALTLGVDNPINDVNITDKASVVGVAKKMMPILMAIQQELIADYRQGKTELVTPPSPATGEPPVTADAQPKNNTEARRLAHTMLGGLLRKTFGQ